MEGEFYRNGMRDERYIELTYDRVQWQVNFIEMGCKDERFIELTHDLVQWQAVILAVFYFQLSENK
jgi:hypothetical protein